MGLASLMAKHTSISAAVLVGKTGLPALATGNLVGFHLHSVLLDASEDVKPPVIPHWGASLDDVVRLRVQLRQHLDWTVSLLCFFHTFDLFALFFDGRPSFIILFLELYVDVLLSGLFSSH